MCGQPEPAQNALLVRDRLQRPEPARLGGTQSLLKAAQFRQLFRKVRIAGAGFANARIIRRHIAGQHADQQFLLIGVHPSKPPLSRLSDSRRATSPR